MVFFLSFSLSLHPSTRYTPNRNEEEEKTEEEKKNIPSLVVVILWLAVAIFPYSLYVMEYLIWSGVQISERIENFQ